MRCKEVLAMREICPSCGKDMVATTEAFAESELWDIESFMRDNMHNIYDQIRGEGAWA